MAGALDLDAYFARIGFSGALAVAIETVDELARLHAAAITFENLSPLLGHTVDLRLEALQRKMVTGRRGGWCFEQNLLFAEVLRRIGFEVSGLGARVLWGSAEDAITARSHMLLRIELGGRTHLADVGFGAHTPTSALLLEVGREQKTAHEDFRLIVIDGDWRLQARIGGEWRALYRFDLQRQYPVDYEVANYFLSTHPSSHFLHGLMAARSVEGARITLRNREFAIHRTGGETERMSLAAPDEIAQVLGREFELDLSGLDDLEASLARLP